MSKSSKKKETEGDSIAGIGNYVFQKTVGEGNFAKVKLSKHKLTGAEVAIKIIDKTQLDEKKLNKLYREVRIMKLLHHPNIVKLYEVIETKNTLFLVMEYSSGGELYDYLVVHGKMKEKDARAKFRQILSAVSYCHKKRVIHRDLKAENLLLDSNLDIKIADFGFSNHFDPDAKLDTFCGSPPYAAPELFQGRRYTGPEVDIWSLGVILYVLTTGCLPFDGKNLQEMRESVCRGKYRIPFYLSDTCEKLLRKFLIRDPFKRSTLDVLIDDPWINEGYDHSPIKADVSEKVEHDEAIVNLIEQRFKVDRKTIMQSLTEGAYDDIAACYYVMYFEKDTRVKIENEVKAMVAGGSSSLLVSSPGTAIAKEVGGDQASSPSRTAVYAAGKTAASKVSQDEEEDEAPAEMAAPSKAKAVSPRKRRQTVGGDNEFAKLEVEESEKKTAGALKKMQVTDMAAKEPVVPTVVAKVKPLGPASAGVTKTVAKPVAKPAAAAPAQESEDGENDKVAPIGGDDSTGTPQGRKRHNTIVGIFRNTIRRPSEAGSPPNGGVSPSTDKGLKDFPDSSNQEEPEQPDQPGEPRSLRFTFNSNSTSTKPPEEVINEVIISCKKHLVVHKVIGKYVVECNMAGAGAENVKFEIEVCKLPRLKNLHGLRFKRLAGSSIEYKDICEKILASCQLV